jgi:3-hydroxyisobutyrate dehydrogenase-like beta-hydroxyacid dehydrogenase
MKLGFIGLGHLGTPIAENLLANTKQLYVYNRTVAKAQALTEKGAVLCKSVKELASLCDIVFSIVSDDAALKQITIGNEGVAANLNPGGIHVCISTILPATAKELSALHKQRNNYYVASPVMGRPEAARAGKLVFLVSGDPHAVDTAKPLLQQAGAASVWEMGNEAEAANTAKLCSNLLIVSAIESMAEGIALAEKSGIDAGKWMNMLQQTLFNAPIYINYGNILLKKAYQPAGFSLRLGLKDINLMVAQASSVAAKLPFGELLQKRFKDGVENGLAEHDWTAIALALKNT